jgi:hypothetical protein
MTSTPTTTADESEYLRRIIAFLLVQYVEKSAVDLWDDDIDAMTGTLTVEVSPGRKNSTRLTYTHGQARQPKPERKPINHREQAEKHASQAAHLKSDRQHHPIDPVASDFHLRMAMVHATLARGEESSAGAVDMRDALTLLRRRESAVRRLVAAHIVQALQGQHAGRQQAALRLARDLDEAGANVDDLLNEELGGEGWTPAPNPMDLCADVPSPVRRAIANQLAQMLLSSDGDAVHAWARNVASALANEGADLNDAIKTRIYELTLGNTDVPF